MKQTPEPLKSQVQIRAATEADVPFIFNSWLKSYRNSLKTVSNAVYFNGHHKVIEALLATSTVSVACDTSDNTQLFGYLVHEEVDGVVIVHYAYVKHPFRKLGILKQLLGSANIIGKSGFYTHQTSGATKLADKMNFVFNPYIAYGIR